MPRNIHRLKRDARWLASLVETLKEPTYCGSTLTYDWDNIEARVRDDDAPIADNLKTAIMFGSGYGYVDEGVWKSLQPLVFLNG